MELGPALCGAVAVVCGSDDCDGAAEGGHREVGGARSRGEGWGYVGLRGSALWALMVILWFSRLPVCRNKNKE